MSHVVTLTMVKERECQQANATAAAEGRLFVQALPGAVSNDIVKELADNIDKNALAEDLNILNNLPASTLRAAAKEFVIQAHLKAILEDSNLNTISQLEEELELSESSRIALVDSLSKSLTREQIHQLEQKAMSQVQRRQGRMTQLQVLQMRIRRGWNKL